MLHPNPRGYAGPACAREYTGGTAGARVRRANTVRARGLKLYNFAVKYFPKQ
jgi:hypothetical protein